MHAKRKKSADLHNKFCQKTSYGAFERNEKFGEDIENKLSADLHNFSNELLNEKDFLLQTLNIILDEETQGLIIRSRL